MRTDRIGLRRSAAAPLCAPRLAGEGRRPSFLVPARDFARADKLPELQRPTASFGRGDDTVGNLHRAQICRFELFELFVSMKFELFELFELFKLSIEQFGPTVSLSTVPSPLPL